VNHTLFLKEDCLPYWASGQQSYEGWSCRVCIIISQRSAQKRTYIWV